MDMMDNHLEITKYYRDPSHSISKNGGPFFNVTKAFDTGAIGLQKGMLIADAESKVADVQKLASGKRSETQQEIRDFLGNPQALVEDTSSGRDQHTQAIKGFLINSCISFY